MANYLFKDKNDIANTILPPPKVVMISLFLQEREKKIL